MFNISPLGMLVALVILGVTIDAVEQESKQAAYVLVVILLLGMITFNAKAFSQQLSIVMNLFKAKAATTQSGSGYKAH